MPDNPTDASTPAKTIPDSVAVKVEKCRAVSMRASVRAVPARKSGRLKVPQTRTPVMSRPPSKPRNSGLAKHSFSRGLATDPRLACSQAALEKSRTTALRSANDP